MPVPQYYSDHNGDPCRVRDARGSEEDASKLQQEPDKKQHNATEITRPRSRQETIARLKREVRPRYDPRNAGWVGDISRAEQGSKHSPLEADISSRPRSPAGYDTAEEAGRAIERPRSAFHSGDFRESKSEQDRSDDAAHHQPLSTSPPAPWSFTFDGSARAGSHRPVPSSNRSQSYAFPTPQGRSRAATQGSLSSSFVLPPPTSPLALQANTDDSDDSRSRSRSPNKSLRRRTFSPGVLQSLRPSIPSMRREETFPRQAHQPRRSISSLHSFSTPQTPLPASRRASIVTDSSPLQGTHMVGSYEESILRGRMSSATSKPLDFMAQIGVLGKGECRSSLRCPPHMVIPFPAVYYDYGRAGNALESGPSPYVGTIDLESREVPEGKRRRRQSESEGQLRGGDADGDIPMLSVSSTTHAALAEKQASRQSSVKVSNAPPGAYRIPQQGQLQVIIKNPHKTAVKLFLIPYDLTDMLPGQKTFIRQRSYSAGPILDMPLDARKNLGTDRPEASLSASDDPNDRPVLRYLIHLHICCPSRGRFYLYKSIRAVFANRVPDGKEKLRNEVQLPQPRYSQYRPDAEKGVGHPMTRARGFSLNSATESAMDLGFEDNSLPRYFPPSRARFSLGAGGPQEPIPEVNPNGSLSSDTPYRPNSRDPLPGGPSPISRPSFQSRASPNFSTTGRMSFERTSTPSRNGRASPSAQNQPGDGLIGMQLRHDALGPR